MFSTQIVRQATRSQYLSTILKPSLRGRLSVRQARLSTQAVSKISDVIIKDHDELKEYYNEVIQHPNDHDHQERFANQFVWELARHSVAEELVVYPAMERFVENGREMAEKDREQHHVVKDQLKAFQNMKASDPQFTAQLKALWANLAEHIKEEEESELPALEKALASDGSTDSEDLATSFDRTKMFVPSRSHPSAGEHPPFETAMGLLTAPIDRITDLFRKFPDKTAK